MKIKNHIPNSITLLNLFCGCVALVFVFNRNFETAFFFVALGIFFDFFDGFFARLFQVSSPLGLQLDSLADMVTSGVVPGFVVYQMLLNTSNIVYNQIQILPFFGFIITLGACYRLANFNIDSRQTDSFIGLPTPANTLFIMSLPMILKYSDSLILLELLINPWFLIFISFTSAVIMNAEIPLFSLKIKKMKIQDNLLQIIFLIVSALFLIVFQFLGIAIVIVFYVLLSVLKNKFQKSKF